MAGLEAGADDYVSKPFVAKELSARIRALARRTRTDVDRTSRELLIVESDAADVVIRADKRRLERALTNLIDNADKHGGGLSGVRVVRDEKTVCVLVDDDGPGVPVDERARIFERFAVAAGAIAPAPRELDSAWPS